MQNDTVTTPEISNANQDDSKQAIYFIELRKPQNKKIKIPCSNETIAKKLLARLSGVETKHN